MESLDVVNLAQSTTRALGTLSVLFQMGKIVKNIFKRGDYGSWLEATSTTRSRGSTCDLGQMACKAYGISSGKAL
jgi:hypothetical protein